MVIFAGGVVIIIIVVDWDKMPEMLHEPNAAPFESVRGVTRAVAIDRSQGLTRCLESAPDVGYGTRIPTER